jgi:hypothetical protein
MTEGKGSRKRRRRQARRVACVEPGGRNSGASPSGLTVLLEASRHDLEHAQWVEFGVKVDEQHIVCRGRG